MSAPKPTPDAWDVICTCGARVGRWPMHWQDPFDRECIGDDYAPCPSCGEDDPCVTSGVDWGALWGERWADVAWMAAAVEIVIEQSGYQPGSLDDPKGEIDEFSGRCL